MAIGSIDPQIMTLLSPERHASPTSTADGRGERRLLTNGPESRGMDTGILKTNVKYDEIIDMSFVESVKS
jgi:hypothetical protein